MNILSSFGSFVAAAILAAPICLTCVSAGFTGVAALVGALVVMSLV
jgi:hypothetical protein